MSAPGGFAIHDPDVVLTDLALALLGACLGWRLARATNRGPMTRTGVVIMGALASAAFWGATFHAFFPAGTTTAAGFMAWVPVVLSILVVAAALLELGLRVSLPRVSPRARHAIVAIYAVAFAAVALLVDASFRTIVSFYAPVVLLFLFVALWQAARSGDGGWTLIAASFAVSLVAAGVQQARVSLHENFDHNAVYHVLQGVALVLLYRGFLRPAAVSREGKTPAAASS